MMRPIKLVIVDDHALFREGLKWIFSMEKEVAVVGEASRADEVAGIVEQTRPDVLLLDLKMPKGEAVEILREVSRKSPDTRVLILTAFSDAEDILKVASEGARGYVLKGVDSSTLIKAIRTVREGGVWVDRDIPAADEFTRIARGRSGD